MALIKALVMKKTSHMGEVTRTVKGSGAGKGKEPKTLSFVAWEMFSQPLNDMFFLFHVF